MTCELSLPFLEVPPVLARDAVDVNESLADSPIVDSDS